MKSKIFGFTILAAGLLGLALPEPHFGESTAFVSRGANKYQLAQAKTVLVKVDDGSGSGVVIHRGDKTFVWTARHVVETNTVVILDRQLRVNGHKSGHLVFAAKVLATFPEVDAALLWVDCPVTAFEGAEFSGATPVPGTTLFHVGNFLGELFDGSVSRGILSQVGVHPNVPGWHWTLTDQTDLTALPGSSGGPVFSEDGKVVGLIVGGPLQGVSCYIPVRELLRGAKRFEWAIFGDVAPSEEALQRLWRETLPKPTIDCRKP